MSAIAKQSKPFGDHLAKSLQIGSVFWYRRWGGVVLRDGSEGDAQ